MSVLYAKRSKYNYLLLLFVFTFHIVRSSIVFNIPDSFMGQTRVKNNSRQLKDQKTANKTHFSGHFRGKRNGSKVGAFYLMIIKMRF